MDYSLGKKLEKLVDVIESSQLEVAEKKDYDLAVDKLDEIKYLLLGIIKYYQRPE